MRQYTLGGKVVGKMSKRERAKWMIKMLDRSIAKTYDERFSSAPYNRTPEKIVERNASIKRMKEKRDKLAKALANG